MNRWVSGALRVEVIGECVGEWGPVNGICLWCSICLGHPKASIGVLVTGLVMGLRELGVWVVILSRVVGW